MAELDGQVALVTGGGRGIGASIAHELASAGARVAVSARSADEVDAVAREIDGLAVVADVARREEVDAMVRQVEERFGPIEFLAANAGIGLYEQAAWDVEPEEWWRVFEVNVLGAYLSCRAVIPSMLERGTGRIVITGSGAAYLPGSSNTAYSASKAAAWRFGETLAAQLEGRIPVFVISPGLVRVLASGRADDLAGRYIHAEHDDIEDLIRRADAIRERDLNAIRLQR